MFKSIKGKVWLLGDNIDTDVILPGQYIVIADPRELGRYAMAGLDPDFTAKISQGDIIVAGRNFGCGSSREQAPIALKNCGIAAVVAESFSRIFYRNAISIGLPLLICPGIASKVQQGEMLELDIPAAKIHKPGGFAIEVEKLPKFMLGILADGGLVGHLKQVNHRQEDKRNGV